VDRGQQRYPLREVEWVKNKEKPTIRWRDEDNAVYRIDIMDWFMQKWPTRMEYVKWCLVNGDVNAKDNYGWTPLHGAAWYGYKDVVELLLANKADANAIDKDGKTTLHWAAAAGHKDIVELLLANKADVNMKDGVVLTPLHYAARNGHKDIVELLLANKADVNAKASDGWTPLHSAARNGHKDIVELLKKRGAK